MSTESNENPIPPIRIEDLPVEQPLSEEEQAQTFGACHRRLSLEPLESRELGPTALAFNHAAGLLHIEGTSIAETV